MIDVSLIEEVLVADIIVPERMRKTDDEEQIRALAESMRRLGQLVPIDLVRRGDKSVLVAGRRRLEALRLNGKDTVKARYLKADDVEAKLVEIAENLHRQELTALERAEHNKEWLRLSKAKRISGNSPENSRGRGRPQDDTRAAARALGIDETSAKRAVTIALGLTEEAKAAAVDAGLADNQSALLAVAKTEPAAQPEALNEAAKQVREKKERTRKASASSQTRIGKRLAAANIHSRPLKPNGSDFECDDGAVEAMTPAARLLRESFDAAQVGVLFARVSDPHVPIGALIKAYNLLDPKLNPGFDSLGAPTAQGIPPAGQESASASPTQWEAEL